MTTTLQAYNQLTPRQRKHVDRMFGCPELWDCEVVSGYINDLNNHCDASLDTDILGNTIKRTKLHVVKKCRNTPIERHSKKKMAEIRSENMQTNEHIDYCDELKHERLDKLYLANYRRKF